ncbi:MAG: IS66 family insertion sequence element accessory protein TnpB [Candidatus Ornithospirochaeta sp.]
MFDHLKEYSIYIKPGFTDMRKHADSLSLLVRSEMGMDPTEKSIFIFCRRTGMNTRRCLTRRRTGWRSRTDTLSLSPTLTPHPPRPWRDISEGWT